MVGLLVLEKTLLLINIHDFPAVFKYDKIILCGISEHIGPVNVNFKSLHLSVVRNRSC